MYELLEIIFHLLLFINLFEITKISEVDEFNVSSDSENIEKQQ